MSVVAAVRRWLKRAGIITLVLLAIAALAGSIYETRARHRVANAFPPPGILVDVGGRRIHLDCRGTGTPTVVFEAGLDLYGSLSWAAVHEPVARITRACAYDRAGIMWSDPSPGPRNADAIARDLHDALTAANERGPYVMVGHSIGGPYLMAFTRQFGADVAGVVFVDASHPDQQQKLKEATGRSLEPSVTGQRVLAALAWSGLPRLVAPAGGHPEAPAAANAAMSAYLPQSLGAMVDELAAMDETFRQAGALRSFGDLPLRVLTAMAPVDDAALAALELTPEQGRRLQAAWLDLHDDQATWSSRSRHLLLDDAHHYIQFERPDAVVDAIRGVVMSVRRR